MIHLIDVSKSYLTKEERKVILHPTNLSIPTTRRIGILARNGEGKSTLLRMISGAEPPDTGSIYRYAKISWPLGFAGAFHPDLTGRENVRFVARIYDMCPDEMASFVDDFSEIGSYMDMPLRTYSSGMRARVTFAASMAIEFDFYLVDEIMSVGDKWFKRKAKLAFEERASKSGMLLVSHNLQTIKEYCDSAILLKKGRLRVFENIDDGIRAYNSS